MSKNRVKRDPVVQPPDQSIRYIPLTQGKVAIVDAVDYEWLSEWNWYAHRDRCTWYAVRTKKRIAMHQEICRTHKIAPEVDHRDGDGLNNRRSNLRPCVHSQNMFNTRIYRSNKSGYRGVCRKSGPNPWVAQIQARKKKLHLGRFATAEEAARVYDAAAVRLFGEFAQLNFPTLQP